jgi:hypothetical protein
LKKTTSATFAHSTQHDDIESKTNAIKLNKKNQHVQKLHMFKVRTDAFLFREDAFSKNISTFAIKLNKKN